MDAVAGPECVYRPSPFRFGSTPRSSAQKITRLGESLLALQRHLPMALAGSSPFFAGEAAPVAVSSL
jgi:hypothetical protein